MDTINYILSIDPGAKGFLCVLHVARELVMECIPIPTWKVKVNKKDRTKVDEENLSKQIHLLIDKYIPLFPIFNLKFFKKYKLNFIFLLILIISA